MRQKEYSFLIFNHTGSPIKRFSVSGRFFTASFCTVIIAFIALTVFIVDYLSLRKDSQQATVFAERMTQQNDLIDLQQSQIQSFAVQINDLKDQLSILNDFEKKMRIIASIENGEDETEGVFGVGGSMPEDLDPTIEMKELQSALFQEMHEQVEHLDIAAVSQQERFKTIYEQMEEQRNMLACTPTIRPIKNENEYYISSSFGYRTSPFTDQREFHEGLDIATENGVPIIASAAGVVSFSGVKGLLGNTIVINHGYGFTTRYGHCQQLLKKQGDEVKRGEVIATVGNSGRSTGFHVHYEVHLNKVPVDPKRYILN